MRIFIFFALVFFVAAEEKYYDLEEIDLSNVGNNVGELKKFMDCLLDRIPCSGVYGSYRDRVSESVQTACRKCTPQLKQFASEFFVAVKQYIPQDYDNFFKKYDPTNEFRDPLMTAINEYKL